ncbi:MAG: lantibiotic dehydratase C-terminal domain-containing protein [Acidobacteriota bacterium]
MKTWRSYHLHSSDLDLLALGFVDPFLDRHRDSLDRCFWERHSAGGAHLRVRIEAEAETAARVGAALEAEAASFFKSHPSADLSAAYSEESVRALLERENASFCEDELVYRHDVAVQRSFPPEPLGYESEEAARFVWDFAHDSTPLMAAILSDPRPKLELVLRLYFAHAALAVGSVRAGSVSWRSHWEGFRSKMPSQEVLDRISAAYEEQRELIHGHLVAVDAMATEDSWQEDPILDGWKKLIRRYRQRVHQNLEAGHVFTQQPKSAEEAQTMREDLEERLVRKSSFISTFWSNDRFLTSLGQDRRFQSPRILVNLFYSMVARVGVSPLQKMVFCHHVQRSVQEHFECDLLDQLSVNMANVVQRQSEARSSGAE